MGSKTYDFDADLLFKDAGLIAASQAASVGGQAKVIDVGNARTEMTLVVDVSAIEVGSNDEEYDILVQGCALASFASGVENLGQLNLGAAAVRQGGAQVNSSGRFELLFTNEQDDTVYRYLRVYIVVAGSIATGINFTAFGAKLPGK